MMTIPILDRSAPPLGSPDQERARGDALLKEAKYWRERALRAEGKTPKRCTRCDRELDLVGHCNAGCDGSSGAV